MFPAQEFHTHKMKWVDFLISKYSHFGLDHRGVTVSVWACCGVEGGCSCSSPKLCAGLVAPLLTTVPHHVVRSCCGMHAAVSAVSVKMYGTGCGEWQVWKKNMKKITVPLVISSYVYLLIHQQMYYPGVSQAMVCGVLLELQSRV